MQRLSLVCLPLLALSAMVTSACHPAARSSSAPAFHFVVVDKPETQQFVLTLQSIDQRPLCLEQGSWPSAVAGPPMSLHAGSTVLPRNAMAPLAPYCPGGCAYLHIPPGGRLTAVIPYWDFGAPQEIAAMPDRTLEFVPRVMVCPQQAEA